VATDENAAAPRALPPPLLLYQMAIGHYVSRALHLAAKLGIADLLGDGPRRAGELALATETHAPSLQRVMRLLASVGVFEEQEDGAFALAPIGELLRAGAPGSMRAMVMLFARTSPDSDPFASMARDPAQAALFDEAMAASAPMIGAAVAAAYDALPSRRSSTSAAATARS
jgi:hypothetical protein